LVQGGSAIRGWRIPGLLRQAQGFGKGAAWWMCRLRMGGLPAADRAPEEELTRHQAVTSTGPTR
jgi:hypothetical protein